MSAPARDPLTPFTLRSSAPTASPEFSPTQGFGQPAIHYAAPAPAPLQSPQSPPAQGSRQPGLHPDTLAALAQSAQWPAAQGLRQPAYGPTASAPAPTMTAPPVIESVGRGLAWALLGVLLGVAATLTFWELGFISSWTSFLLSAVSLRLYVRGAGRTPQRGVVPLILLIVAGVLLCFGLCVAGDAYRVYLENPGEYGDSAVQFVLLTLGNAQVWQAYGRVLLMYLVFAGLGIAGMLMSLRRQAKEGR